MCILANAMHSGRTGRKKALFPYAKEFLDVHQPHMRPYFTKPKPLERLADSKRTSPSVTSEEDTRKEEPLSLSGDMSSSRRSGPRSEDAFDFWW